MADDDYDLIVLGGGAAGLGAARAGLWEGASVALISDSPLGGDCTFTGCVPSKALIEASRQGLSFSEALDRVHRVVDTVAATESAEVLRHDGADVFETRAEFVGPRTLEVAGQRITGRNVIIATGSRPAMPPIDGLSGVSFVTNEAFFDRRKQPDSMVIVGAGPIGCELGEAMARFGTTVTIVEFLPRVLARFEPDASALVEQGLRSFNIDLRLDTGARSVRPHAGQIAVDLGDTTVVADELMIATGRTPNSSGFGLETTGVSTDERGFIETDRWLRTNVTGVYAVGDVNGKQLLSHAADEMGRVAAWTALRRGRRYRYDPRRIPQVVFTTPEVASIGVLESEAPRNALVAEAPMTANDRAQAADLTQGFARLIAKPGVVTRHAAGGKLIGATIVGERAGELINEAALIMRSNAYAGRLAQTVRAYPSWSTVVQKAAARWFYEYEGEKARAPKK